MFQMPIYPSTSKNACFFYFSKDWFSLLANMINTTEKSNLFLACYFSANKKYVPNQPRYSSHTDESPEKSSNICCVYKSRFRKTTPTSTKFRRMGNMRQGALNRRQLYCQYLASRPFAFTPDESLETNNTACLCENRADLPKIGSVFFVELLSISNFKTLLPHKRALKWRQITCYWVWKWSFWLLICKMLHILTILLYKLLKLKRKLS